MTPLQSAARRLATRGSHGHLLCVAGSVGKAGRGAACDGSGAADRRAVHAGGCTRGARWFAGEPLSEGDDAAP